MKWGVQRLGATRGQLASACNPRVTVKRGGGGDWLDAFGSRVAWGNDKVRCALRDLILLHVAHWPWASSGSEVDISSQGTSATPLARRARAVRSARMAMSSLPAGPKAKLIGDAQNRTALKSYLQEYGTNGLCRTHRVHMSMVGHLRCVHTIQ